MQTKKKSNILNKAKEREKNRVTSTANEKYLVPKSIELSFFIAFSESDSNLGSVHSHRLSSP